MGRKDTIAAKSIRKMYEQLNLNQSDIFSKTKLLLGVYRDVVWITLSESARVNEELAYYGEELDSALVYLELFAPDTEKQEFESRISALFENKWMVEASTLLQNRKAQSLNPSRTGIIFKLLEKYSRRTILVSNLCGFVRNRTSSWRTYRIKMV